MKRRAFLTGVGSVAAIKAAKPGNMPAVRRKTTAMLPPRKVIVGTVIQQFWGKHPGLEKRLEELAAIVDRMRAESERKYGRSLDLAILPENAVTGEIPGDSNIQPVSWEGPVSDVFTRKAREHHCYIIAPTYLRESDDKSRCSNAALLVGRKGELVGTYRKMHLVVSLERKRFEADATPGREATVFDCDFGKLGIQICYDMEFNRGWQELARKGAELVAWPTQSPQTAQPAARAKEQTLLHRLQYLAQQCLDFRADRQDHSAGQAAGEPPGSGTGSQLRHSAVEFETAEGQGIRREVRRQGRVSFLR